MIYLVAFVRRSRCEVPRLPLILSYLVLYSQYVPLYSTESTQAGGLHVPPARIRMGKELCRRPRKAKA